MATTVSASSDHSYSAPIVDVGEPSRDGTSVRIYQDMSKKNDKLFTQKPLQSLSPSYAAIAPSQVSTETAAQANKICLMLSTIKRTAGSEGKNVADIAARIARRSSICGASQPQNTFTKAILSPGSELGLRIPGRIAKMRRLTTHGNANDDLLNLKEVRPNNHYADAGFVNSPDALSNKIPRIVAIVPAYPREAPERSGAERQPGHETATERKTVKILSVNELNQRYEQMQPKSPQKPAPPRPTVLKPTEQSHGNPIHVSLIRRSSDELDLIFTMNDKAVTYETLTPCQRSEVQRSLLDEEVWLKMLDHIKAGRPSTKTLTLFQLLLPANEANHFFAEIGSNQLAQSCVL